MKISILSPFSSIPYFTIEAVRQLLEDDSIAAGTVQTTLYRWMKTGEILQLKKGVYMTRRFFETHRTDPEFSMAVSAILLPQSYVSLEYALQSRGVLTEVTYPVTSVTIKHTRTISTKLGTFSYRNIRSDLYTGFEMNNYQGISFAKATPAKALFDYLYLRSMKGMELTADYDLAEDLRLNLEDFSDGEKNEFSAIVEVSRSRKMKEILANLRRTIWRP